MRFLWPWVFVVLPVLALIAWGWVRRFAHAPSSAHALHPDLEVLTTASNQGSRWRKALSPVLFGLAVLLGVAALARPLGPTLVPDRGASVVLALDVSRSMHADDIPPSRIEAAKRAAQTFISSLPEGVRVGLVSFAADATTNTPLTGDRERVLEAIDGLNLGSGTAIGAGLIEGLRVLSSATGSRTVVLLSDGSNTAGVLPLIAALKAKERGVRVHTIGVGTLGLRYNPGGSLEGAKYWMGFDEAALREVAKETGGQYLFVDSSAALERAYRSLSRALGWRTELGEISDRFALFAGVCLCSSLLVGHWSRRIV